MTHPNLIERLNDAATENLCLVWYRGHALPLVGMKDSEGDYLLRGSPYDDTFVHRSEVDFVLPLQAISTLTAEVEELRALLTDVSGLIRVGGVTHKEMTNARSRIATLTKGEAHERIA